MTKAESDLLLAIGRAVASLTSGHYLYNELLEAVDAVENDRRNGAEIMNREQRRGNRQV